MSKQIFIVLFLSFSLFSNIEFIAQENLVSITLFDSTMNLPIAGANFNYGDQKGSSDSDGKLEFKIIDDGILNLSHVQYGRWSLSGKELKKAIEFGRIYRNQEVLSLQPVTIIALHAKINENQSLELDYRDKLSHDGGSVLSRTASIGLIKKSGNYGFDPVLRGFKYDQLNVVIDGVQCAVAACPNRMDPPTSQIAPNMMDRVEIIKGPHSLRYGSAFGGTINFISSSPKFTESNQTYGRISGSSESNGGILRTEGLVGLSGEKYDVGILGSFSKGNDYTDGNGDKIPAKFQRGSAGLNLGLKLLKEQSIRLSVTHNFAENTDFPSLPMDLISDNTTLLNLIHNADIGGINLKNWSTSFYATFVYHKMNNYMKEINPRMVDAKTDANTLSFGGRTEGSWIFPNSRLFAGSDMRLDRADGTREREFLMGPNTGNTVEDNVWNGGQIYKIGIFGEYQHFYTGFTMILSGRMEYNSATATDLNPVFDSKNSTSKNTVFNPSLSIGGILDINENTAVGIYLGRAQRSGSLTERYINSFPVGVDPYDMLGNPDLKPEINNQIDLTFNYRTASTGFDISLFASILQDYISAEIDPMLNPTMPSSPGVRRFNNIDDAFMTGFELDWNQNLFIGLNHRISIAYTYGIDNFRNEPLPEIAPLDLRFILSGNYFENRLHPELSFRHVIKQARISAAFGESETPGFTVIDFALRYNYNNVIGFTLGIHNLLDEPFYEHLSRAVRGMNRAIYEPGRSIYLSLNLDMM